MLVEEVDEQGAHGLEARNQAVSDEKHQDNWASDRGMRFDTPAESNDTA
jgi:hypothetical protein